MSSPTIAELASYAVRPHSFLFVSWLVLMSSENNKNVQNEEKLEISVIDHI